MTCLRSHSKSAESWGSNPTAWTLLPILSLRSPAACQPDIWAEGNWGVPRCGPPLPYMELCLGAWHGEVLAEVGTEEVPWMQPCREGSHLPRPPSL